MNIIIYLFIYVVLGGLCFKLMEAMHIGFDGYWYTGDHDLVWAVSAIIGSALFPITLFFMSGFFVSTKIFNKLKDLLLDKNP